MKLKSIMPAVIGGTIVIYMIKPLLDETIVFLGESSSQILQSWQNKIFNQIPSFDSTELGLLTFMYIIFIILGIAIVFISKPYNKSVELIKKYEKPKEDKPSNTDANISSTEETINPKNFVRNLKILRICMVIYFVLVSCYFFQMLAGFAIITIEQKKFTCKMVLLNSIEKPKLSATYKMKWLKARTKALNLEFHKEVDSVLVKHNISSHEYCDY